MATDILGARVEPCWRRWSGGRRIWRPSRSWRRASCARNPPLRATLAGRFRPHHAFPVGQLLAHLDYLEAVETLSARIKEVIAAFAAQVARLDTIHGVNRRTVEVLVAEMGVDMGAFRSERHLTSWAALSPGNNESAGKHKSGTTRKADRGLRAALTEAPLAAIRTKDSALAARYRRFMRHGGATRRR